MVINRIQTLERPEVKIRILVDCTLLVYIHIPVVVVDKSISGISS